jgi:hypothetical protein
MKSFIAAAAVLAVGVSIAVTSIGGAQTTGERTLKFVDKGGSFKFVDNPPKGKSRNPAPSAGDEFLFTSNLYDESGARAGYVTAHCAFPPGLKGLADCQGEAKVKDGTVSFSGLQNLNGLKNTFSVTGGTGAYEGARGSITSIARSHADNAPSDDTVHLLG